MRSKYAGDEYLLLQSFVCQHLMIIFSFLNIVLFPGETLSVESQNSTENKVDDQCNFNLHF